MTELQQSKGLARRFIKGLHDRLNIWGMPARVNRINYWTSNLLYFYILLGIFKIISHLGLPPLVVGVCEILLVLIHLITNYTLKVKRLRDLDLSGLWIIAFIIHLVCIVGFVVSIAISVAIPRLDQAFTVGTVLVGSILSVVALIVLALEIGILFVRGTRGDNGFGPEPKKASRWDYCIVFGSLLLVQVIFVPTARDLLQVIQYITSKASAK
jgi:uncharacterized membrane protein YhaH (DUF805 family)